MKATRRLSTYLSVVAAALLFVVGYLLGQTSQMVTEPPNKDPRLGEVRMKGYNNYKVCAGRDLVTVIEADLDNQHIDHNSPECEIVQ